MRDVLVGCSALLLAWVIVFGTAIARGSPDARRPLLVSAALLTLSSAGTMMGAFWLRRRERPADGSASTRRIAEVILLVFVVLGAVGAWSAPLRPDVFRAIYLIVLLAAMYVIKQPPQSTRTRAPVRTVSAWVFAAIAVAHMVRLLTRTPVTIGWWSVPEWISVAAVFAAAALAFWNVREGVPATGASHR